MYYPKSKLIFVAINKTGSSSMLTALNQALYDPNVPDIWMSTLASGRSIAKFPTLLTISTCMSPSRNNLYNATRSLFGVAPVIRGMDNSEESFRRAFGFSPALLPVLKG